MDDLKTMAMNLIDSGYSAQRAAIVLRAATRCSLKAIVPAVRDAKLALGHTWCGEYARPMSFHPEGR